MQTKSKKAKARRLQQDVVHYILSTFPELTENDVRSTPMGLTGADVLLSEKAQQQFPYHVECKAHEAFSVYKFYDQAAEQQPNESLIPLVIIKANGRTPLVILDIEDFFELLGD